VPRGLSATLRPVDAGNADESILAAAVAAEHERDRIASARARQPWRPRAAEWVKPAALRASTALHNG
jgi:hypothetical protein